MSAGLLPSPTQTPHALSSFSHQFLPTAKHYVAPRSNPGSRSLTTQQAMDLQNAYRAGGVTTAQLGAKYGISQQSAHRIATGRHYADLDTAPKVHDPRTWVDPTVRRRGIPSPAERRVLTAMLKANPGREALIKVTKTKPNVDHWDGTGVVARVVKQTSSYAVYLSWPNPVELAA